ncbi:MAG: prolyl oligopeptidase family serine peptidase [Candidatus Riflebacteria bacterium]|nr:prolyl oligopeptidase family serine peptidase [Candidatus Riflebacteria bacterium]
MTMNRWMWIGKAMVVAALGAFLIVGLAGAAMAREPGRVIKWLMERKVQQTPLPAGTVEKTIEHGGRTRRFYVHPPAGWDGTTPLPAVFFFHGGGGGGKHALASYGLVEKADDAGFLLVVPDGTGKIDGILLTWNVKFGFGEAARADVDDGGFVTALIDQVARDYPLDQDRLFATGMSNGGFLCHWLAARPDNRFAAIAPVVGSLGGRRQDQKDWQLPPTPVTPVSVLAINGLLDQHVPLAGGLQKKSLETAAFMTSASQTMRFWVEANGCREPPEVAEEPAKGFTCWRWTGGRGGTEVVQFVLHRQGHAWPGAKPQGRRQADPPDPDFAANDLIWKFFAAHPRKREAFR